MRSPGRRGIKAGAITSQGICATREGALQLEATRTRFVTALHGALAAQPFHESARIVALSDVSGCSAGVRWPGSKTAATVVAAC